MIKLIMLVNRIGRFHLLIYLQEITKGMENKTFSTFFFPLENRDKNFYRDQNSLNYFYYNQG